MGPICLGANESHIYPNMCAIFGCGPTVVSREKGGTDTLTAGMKVIGRFVTNHICPRRYVTKRSDMFQNDMDDLSQFCLVLGQFVTLLFWTICHKSYLS